MLIQFNNADLEKLCQTFKLGSRKWGSQVMKKVVQRLNELQAVQNLEDLQNLSSGARPHPLKGRYAEFFAVDLHSGKRMIFKSTNNPKEYETPDGIDRKKITSIKILKIEDYHGRKK